MRITHCLAGLTVGSLVLFVVLSVPGCDSGPAKGLGNSLEDAPASAPGQMSSDQFNKNRKKK